MSTNADIDAPVAGTELRAALGRFATGVTVVAARDADGRAFASTANAFSSVSLEPPLVLVCLKDGSETLAAGLASGHLAISVLADDQRELAERFASRASAEDWDGVDHAAGATGAPLLDRALVTLDCALHDVADGGDHRIVVARVLAVEHPREEGAPLLFHRGDFARLEGGEAPASAPRGGTPTTRDAGRPTTEDRDGAAAAQPPPAAELPTALGDLRAIGVPTGRDDLAAMLAVHGDPAGVDGVRVHVHRGCILGDALGHRDCATRTALEEALAAIRADGAGVVAYVRDDRSPFSGCCVGPATAPPLPEGTRRALAGPLADLGLAGVRLTLSSAQLGEPAAVARRLGLRLTDG